MLEPYTGTYREHYRDEVRTCGGDRSGTVSYRFNSLGFRCEEFDPDARRRVFVCGCSFTIGEGLAVEEAWPSVFARLYAAAHGLDRREVSLMNFSQSGASNDYIARTLLAQVGAERPDLVLALFSEPSRVEYVYSPDEIAGLAATADFATLRGRPASSALGPWLPHGWLSRRRLVAAGPSKWRPHSARVLQWASRHYRNPHPVNELASTLRSMLLVKYFLENRRIPYLCSIIEPKHILDPRWSDHPALGSLWRAATAPPFCRPFLDEGGEALDRAADGLHPGPDSHRAFAERIFADYRNAHVPATPS